MLTGLLASDFQDDMNVTIISLPKLGMDTVCVNQSIHLSCHTDQLVEDIIFTWFWLIYTKEGTAVIAQATPNKVLYTCKVFSNNGDLIGEANVTVIANGEFVS